MQSSQLTRQARQISIQFFEFVINEVTLTGQPYALNTDQSVDQVLKAAKAEVVSMHRIAVGEGIEKVVEDYAAEVAKAMQV